MGERLELREGTAQPDRDLLRGVAGGVEIEPHGLVRHADRWAGHAGALGAGRAQHQQADREVPRGRRARGELDVDRVAGIDERSIHRDLDPGAVVELERPGARREQLGDLRAAGGEPVHRRGDEDTHGDTERDQPDISHAAALFKTETARRSMGFTWLPVAWPLGHRQASTESHGRARSPGQE